MNKKDKKLVIGAVLICIFIGILSPFIASSNPDGLEKTAEQISTTEKSGTYHAPLADYSVPGLGKIGEIGAMLIGIIVTLIIAFIAANLLRKRKPKSD